MAGPEGGTAPDVPGTPNAVAQRAKDASPLAATLQPQPRRAPAVRPGHKPGSPGSDGGGARGELELWGAGKPGARAAAASEQGGSPPLSAVSTSAGMTPSPEGRARPSRGRPGAARHSPARASLAPTKEAPDPQSKKVFVGGVPQEMSEEELQGVFGDHWVKTAWLQQCRVGAGGGRGATNAQRKHRGFGFVVFYDADAVDQILGKAGSKFIKLDGKFEGKQLEVKRAVRQTTEPQTSNGNMPEVLQHRQPVQPSQAPWPTFTSTPTDQQASSRAWPTQQAQPWPTQQAQPYCMLPMPCGGVRPMMSQNMPQMPTMPPQVSPLQQMQQMQQMPQVVQVLNQWQATHALPQQPQLGLAPPPQQQPQQGQGGCFQPCGPFRMAAAPGAIQR